MKEKLREKWCRSISSWVKAVGQVFGDCESIPYGYSFPTSCNSSRQTEREKRGCGYRVNRETGEAKLTIQMGALWMRVKK